MARATVVIDSSDESSSERDDSSSRPSNPLVDDQAADSDDDASSDTVDIPPDEQFPQFMRLPIEIRRQIWDVFCPDVANKHPRVLHLSIMSPYGNQDGSPWYLSDAFATVDQTEQVRKLGSIHHETRLIVTKAFPEVITMKRADDDLRFDPDRDIIFLNENPDGMPGVGGPPPAGVCDKIKHICFNLDEYPMEDARHDITLSNDQIAILKDIPKLETVMMGLHPYPSDLLYRLKGWLADEQTIEARFTTFEKSEGVGEDLEWVFIWPDYKNHPQFLEHSVWEPWRDTLSQDIQEYAIIRSAKIVPMLVFPYDSLGYLDRLRARYAKKPWEGYQGSDCTSEHDSDVDDDDESIGEYESDGINDDTIAQWDDHDEDEIVPPAISSGGPISIPSDDSEDDVIEAGQPTHSPQAGNFSSPEPASGEEQAKVGPRRPKRRIVSDSDDEDDHEPSAKRIRMQAVPVSSDEDEDEVPRPRGGSRGAPQVISDDEGESSGSSSDDDDDQPKHLSLQQRLQPAPTIHPQVEADNGDDSDESNSFCSYANSDEEEENEEDSEGDGLVDRMAGDTDDDNGEGDDDEAW